MKKVIWGILMNILYLFPREIAHKILYRIVMKKKLNLDNPYDLNEKIQWLLLNRYGENEAFLADKYLVKKFLTEKGYGKYIPKLYAVYDNVYDINLDTLPEKFVLKTNNGCGNVFVCKDKNSFNLNKAKKVLNTALKKNFAKVNLEYHYSLIKPKILCEEFLDDGTEKLPTDYKFYCFNGKVECVLVCTDRIDENNKTIAYYDRNWKRLAFESEEYVSSKNIEKPENFEEMLSLASNLSVGHNFVRVDLYNLNGKIYFGELTFTPACGMIYSLKQESLDYLGSYINIGDK